MIMGRVGTMASEWCYAEDFVERHEEDDVATQRPTRMDQCRMWQLNARASLFLIFLSLIVRT